MTSCSCSSRSVRSGLCLIAASSRELWRKLSKTKVRQLKIDSRGRFCRTELNKNFSIVCPLPSNTEKRVVRVEKSKLRFAFRTIQMESLTSINMPTLLLAHVNSPVNVTKIDINCFLTIAYIEKLFYLQKLSQSHRELLGRSRSAPEAPSPPYHGPYNFEWADPRHLESAFSA